jgi:hypothetical protein
MKRIAIFLLVTTLLPAARGQGVARPGGGGGGGAGLAASDQRAMYEDIEIMRQLLARRMAARHISSMECAVCHVVNPQHAPMPITKWSNERFSESNHSPHAGEIGWGDFTSDGLMDLTIANGGNPHRGFLPVSIEGTYVAGHGVVFTMTLPAQTRAEIMTTPPAPEPKRTSEWVRVRDQLRGGKPATSAPPKRDTLTDALLHLLAENGKNFAHLPATENLTIAVTFRDGSAGLHAPFSLLSDDLSRTAIIGERSPGSSGMGGGGGGMGGTATGGPSGGGGGGGMIGGPGSSSGSGTTGSTGGSASTSTEPLTEDRELELLAELHLKRNNLAEAAAAYERAIAKARAVQLEQNLPTDQAKVLLDQANARVRELTRRVAEVYLKLGNLEAAKNALTISPAIVAVDNSSKAPKASASIKMPGKLIVTVSKHVLDQVGSGAVSFAEFQKLAMIETLFETPAQPKK